VQNSRIEWDRKLYIILMGGDYAGDGRRIKMG